MHLPGRHGCFWCSTSSPPPQKSVARQLRCTSCCWFLVAHPAERSTPVLRASGCNDSQLNFWCVNKTSPIDSANSVFHARPKKINVKTCSKQGCNRCFVFRQPFMGTLIQNSVIGIRWFIGQCNELIRFRMRELDFATPGDEDAVPLFWGNDLHNTHTHAHSSKC